MQRNTIAMKVTEIEKKFLETVKSAKKFDESKEIKLYQVGGCVKSFQ